MTAREFGSSILEHPLSWVVGVAMPVIAAGIIGILGFVWQSHSALAVLADRQQRMKTDVSAIRAQLYQGQANHRQQFQDLGEAISENRGYIRGLDRRVRALEAR